MELRSQLLIRIENLKSANMELERVIDKNDDMELNAHSLRNKLF